jgi:hypothetical protein
MLTEQILHTVLGRSTSKSKSFHSQHFQAHQLRAELDLSAESGVPLRLLGLRLVEDKVLVLGNSALVLSWEHLDARLTSDQARGRFSSNSALTVARSGTHANDSSIGPTEGAGAAGVHDIVLQLVESVLLFLKAAPVADWVKATWVDDLVESENADLSVVLNVVWAG